jgi:hypothetical protein
MKFEKLLAIVGLEPVFETGLLLAGAVDALAVRQQLGRWVKEGRLYQLRRGLYALASPFRKVIPHPFLLANRLVRDSYVSLQSALEHHGLIPEHAPVITSVTTRRPGRFITPLGTFDYRHLKTDLFNGYRRDLVAEGQAAEVATPAKALADLIYLEPDADDRNFLSELRLEGLDRVGVPALRTALASRPKLRRSLRHLEDMAREEDDYKAL